MEDDDILVEEECTPMDNALEGEDSVLCSPKSKTKEHSKKKQEKGGKELGMK